VNAALAATTLTGGAAVTALTGTAQPPAVLALSGSGTFDDTLVGTPAARAFMVTNTGQQTTGALTVSQSGSTSFTLLTGQAGDCVSGTIRIGPDPLPCSYR
jgi:hypothetical protein